MTTLQEFRKMAVVLHSMNESSCSMSQATVEAIFGSGFVMGDKPNLGESFRLDGIEVEIDNTIPFGEYRVD